MKTVNIYVDGACSNNGAEDATGGWGAVLEYNGAYKEVSGPVTREGTQKCTNQRAEISAAIHALEMLKEPCNVTLHTDSQYVAGTMSNDWTKKKNIDLWNKLDDIASQHNIIWTWTRGHSGDVMNERANKLAQQEARKG